MADASEVSEAHREGISKSRPTCPVCASRLAVVSIVVGMARASVLAVISGFATRIVSPGRVDRALDKWAQTDRRQHQWIRSRLGSRIGDMVDRCMPGSSRCWPRSVTIRAALLGMGVPARVRIGVRRRAGRIEGHAWVETAHGRINFSPGYLPVEGGRVP